MKRYFYISLIAIIFINACATTKTTKSTIFTPASEEKLETVEAVGMAPIMNNDLLEAKKRSLVDAQKNAVEMVVGVYVNAKTMVEKAILIDQNIIAKTNGYIKKYKILNEGQEQNFYKTKIQALVKIEDINKDLDNSGVIAKKSIATDTRLAVIIDDKIDGIKNKDNTSQITLMEIFAKNNYRVIDQSEIEQIVPSDEQVTNDLRKIKGLGDKLKADVLVVGTATSAFNTDQGLGGMTSYRATIGLKAIKIKQAALIYSTLQSSGGVSVSKEAAAKEALKRAAIIAGEDLVRNLETRLKTFSQAGATIKNITNLNQVNIIVKYLQEIYEVKNATLQSLVNGEAQINIDTEVENLPSIAKKLEENIKDFSLKITELTKDNFIAEIK